MMSLERWTRPYLQAGCRKVMWLPSAVATLPQSAAGAEDCIGVQLAPWLIEPVIEPERTPAWQQREIPAVQKSFTARDCFV